MYFVLLESVCDKAKPHHECTDDFLFFRHECPGFHHCQLWWTAKEHLHLHGIKCPADSHYGQLWGQTEQKLYWDSMHSLVQTTLDGLASQLGSIHGGKIRCDLGFVDTLWWSGCEWGLTVNLGPVFCTAYRIMELSFPRRLSVPRTKVP